MTGKKQAEEGWTEAGSKTKEAKPKPKKAKGAAKSEAFKRLYGR